MWTAVLPYIVTLLIYAAVDVIACLGLNLQFGVVGVANFGFIMFQSVGAYVAAVLSLPPDTANGGFQHYLGGLHLPFPLPWIGAAVAGGLLALPFGGLMSRRVDAGTAGIALLVATVALNLFVTNYTPLFNGPAGLSLVPAPMNSRFDPQSNPYQIAYAVGAVLLCALVFWVVQRITASPYGRSLRAIRENDQAAAAIGKDVQRLRTATLVIGGAAGGFSGAILVGFISLWAPSAWSYEESIVFLSAIIVGGLGSNLGATLGAIIVPVGFLEATRFLPSFGPPELVPALEWVIVGVLLLAFLWFRPQGLIAERRGTIRLNRAKPHDAGDAGPADNPPSAAATELSYQEAQWATHKA